ncbi:MAG: PilX N-terminal domain-containing pilus assembly protein [Candidatus Thiodiazotropha sp.]
MHTHRHKQTSDRQTQKGAALVISLILLVIITLLSVSAMQNTNLDTKITVNHQFKELSFQAAESALAIATAPEPDIQIPPSTEDAEAQNVRYFTAAEIPDQMPELSADLTMRFLYSLKKDEPADPDNGRFGISVSGFSMNSAFVTYMATAQGHVGESNTKTTNRSQVILFTQ